MYVQYIDIITKAKLLQCVNDYDSAHAAVLEAKSLLEDKEQLLCSAENNLRMIAWNDRHSDDDG